MDKCINVVITAYNGLEVLPTALNSLVKQKYKDFTVTIVQNFDGLDYSNIIEEYKEKGLDIDHIKVDNYSTKGFCKQKGIDAHLGCKYVMFFDQNDKFMPEAIQILVGKIEATKANIVLSKYIKETKDKTETIGAGHPEIITQHNGKIYSMQYLDDCSIKFDPELKYADDTYFNFIAFNCSNNISYVDLVTYRNSYDPEAEMNKDYGEYFKNMVVDYISGQAKALMHTRRYNQDINTTTIMSVIIYFYYLVMVSRAKSFGNDAYEDTLKELGRQKFIKDVLTDKKSLVYIANNIRGGFVYKEEAIFFNYSFIDWMNEWLEK